MCSLTTPLRFSPPILWHLSYVLWISLFFTGDLVSWVLSSAIEGCVLGRYLSTLYRGVWFCGLQVSGGDVLRFLGAGIA